MRFVLKNLRTKTTEMKISRGQYSNTINTDYLLLYIDNKFTQNFNKCHNFFNT